MAISSTKVANILKIMPLHKDIIKSWEHMFVFSLTREPCTTTSRQLIEKVHRIRRSPIECHLPACDKLINFHSPKRL